MDMQFTVMEHEFFASTMSVGNGLTAKFWEDRWINGQSISELAPLLHACVPKRHRKSRTVADALLNHRWAQDIQGTLGIHEIGQYLQIWHTMNDTTLTDVPDCLIWKCTANGSYTASSAYLASFHGSWACPVWKHIWAPPRLKFFHWLAFRTAAGQHSALSATACTTTRDALYAIKHRSPCTTCSSNAHSRDRYGMMPSHGFAWPAGSLAPTTTPCLTGSPKRSVTHPNPFARASDQLCYSYHG
jgi:hypothetical protein